MHILDTEFELMGERYGVRWYEVDSFDDLSREKVSQVYGVCLLGEQVVLVASYHVACNLPGGTIEEGESYEQAFFREIQEETNMKVLSWKPIGYQIITRPDGSETYQLRVAARVEKIGEFEKDPAGSVIAVNFCKLAELNEKINYGLVGERLVKRVRELLPTLE